MVGTLENQTKHSFDKIDILTVTAEVKGHVSWCFSVWKEKTWLIVKHWQLQIGDQ